MRGIVEVRFRGAVWLTAAQHHALDVQVGAARGASAVAVTARHKGIRPTAADSGGHRDPE